MVNVCQVFESTGVTSNQLSLGEVFNMVPGKHTGKVIVSQKTYNTK